MPPRRRRRNNDGPNKRERMARQYGFVQAFFDTDPELKRLFNQAVKKTYTPERFIAELRDTKWFRKNSADTRNAILQKTADPKTYDQRVRQIAHTIRDTWGQNFGGTLGHLDKGETRQLAETAYMMGWSEAQVIDHLSKSVNYRKLLRNKRLGGTAAETATKLESLGRAYGLNPGNKWLASQVERIIEGRDTFEGTATRLKDWAKREYSAYAAELDSGLTMQDIAEPYVAKMAELLELPQGAIHLKQGLIQKALHYKNRNGTPEAMSLHEFEQVLRNDSRWQYTNNAREEVMGITNDLLKSFGLTA